jgi:hypothetical protein
MDHVLGNKAVFKKATDTAGDAAIISGAVLASNRDSQEAGLAVLGAGILAKIFSSATRPEADTRTWQNLPQYLSFAVLKLPAGEHELTVEFLTESGRTIADRTKVLNVTVAPGRDNVFYISDQSVSTPVPSSTSSTP